MKRLHLDAVEAAHRELRVAEALIDRTYRHVVPVLDAGQDAESDTYFVVMPVATQSLQDVLDARGALPEQEAVSIAIQVVEGLCEISSLVHRDLKPANILFLDDVWKIADFGIARFVEESTSARTLKDCLSPLYAAPEQWRFEHATNATDVYALGCVIYALVTGAPPFTGSAPELQDKHLHAVHADPPGCRPNLLSALRMMLRKEPSSRPSLDRVLRILKTALEVPQPSGDSSLGRLALAAASHERHVAEVAATRAAESTTFEKRKALAGEARLTLRRIGDDLAARISKAIPSALIDASDQRLMIRVGTSTLEIDFRAGGALFGEEAFPRSKWDVICGAVIEVTQVRPSCKRSANLWYTRQQSRSADYRWYEAAYRGSVHTANRFESEPAAVTPELADRAHWAGMDVVQVAYGPYAVDDEDATSYHDRWTHVLAEACNGRLERLPSALASHGPY